MKPESGASSVRATITFPPDLYETLEDLAKQKKVSLAWVVRDAVEKYVEERPPALSDAAKRRIASVARRGYDRPGPSGAR